MNKPYRLAICSGRYQHIHKIHEFMIDTGLYLADQVVVFIGEPKKNRTPNNPFTFEERKELIKLIYNEEIKNKKLVIYPLIELKELDLNLSDWCNYSCSIAESLCDTKPDLIIEGPDKRAMQFFKPGDMGFISELIISEGILNNNELLRFRGIDIRKYLLFGDYDIWKNFVNEKLWNKFSELRKIIIECEQ